MIETHGNKEVKQATQPQPVGWAVVAEERGDGRGAGKKKIFEINLDQKHVIGENDDMGRWPKLGIRAVLVGEGRIKLELSSTVVNNADISTIGLGETTLFVACGSNEPWTWNFYVSFQATRAEAETIAEAPGFPPSTCKE
jgi:hypothetical protein